MSSPPVGGTIGVRCSAKWTMVEGEDIGTLILSCRECHFSVGKEPELVCEVKRFQMDTIGIT